MRVFVVMMNDYPAAVFKTEPAANAYIATKKAEWNVKWLNENPSHKVMPSYIHGPYWHAYEFEVRS